MLGPIGDLADQRAGDLEAGLGLPVALGHLRAQLPRRLVLEGAGVDLELGEPVLDAVLLGVPLDAVEAQDLAGVGDPG
ncbi:hypothetical protein, partial [Streptomyces reticuliscabiei]|uniref:hypothetical protein n=1 Tax=Streptomyces reticuliscabiei TaxID=146821 RepID=UPI00117D8392